MDAPLADLRILSIEQFGAGPWATMQLADLGADVVKIEHPADGGDVARDVPPYATGQGDSLYFESFNRNKRSIALDLRTPTDRGVFEDLVAQADAVFSNLRGDKPAGLGITYADLAPVNPRIVCCSLSGFGQTGPRAAQGAYDHVIQALSGWMSITGQPDGPPLRTGLGLADFAGGYAAALTLLAAVHRARRDGVGADCDVSLFDTALSLLNYQGTWAATRDHVATRLPDSAHASVVPFQTFAAADGWLAVACPKPILWERLCQALGRPDLLSDPRYADYAGRDAHRDTLIPALSAEFARRTVAHWLELLHAADVPVAPVNDIAEALSDPQAVARGAVVSYEHPRLGTVRQPASPLRVSGHQAPTRPAPAMGADTDAVLAGWCGVTRERVA